MNQQKNEYARMAIMDILQSSNTIEKIGKFIGYKERINDCRIFLFDEECSNFDNSFKNQKIGPCGIVGVGDYTKTWILDSQHISPMSIIQVGKTIDFDLNILTYLNKIMIGREINIDKEEFLKFLRYLKSEGFQYGISTALMERVRTPIDKNILSEMITSFVKFDIMPTLNDNFSDFYIPLDGYMRIKQIYDMTLEQLNEVSRHYDLLCCYVMKAYLIKTYDAILDKHAKVEKLIDYGLNTLNCYLEKEIVLLSLYILDDSRTHKTFKKLKNNSEIIKNILNVTWDIYHIRLIEQIMLYDNCRDKEKVILSYFATADNGLIDAMAINPLKAFVILGEKQIAHHSIGIENVCKNNSLLEELSTMASIREKNIQNIDFAEKRKQLTDEITKLQLNSK